MELPFAVYTAREGATWITGLDAGYAVLEGYRRAAGKIPEFDMGDLPSCGAVNVDDIVVVYRFMCAKKADFRGRDAPYLVLSYFPRAQASLVDIERLLALESFSVPLRDPPACIAYTGGSPAPAEFDPASLAATAPLALANDFATAGATFARPFDGVLRFSRTGADPQGPVRISYTPTADPAALPAPVLTPVVLPSTWHPASPPETPRARHRVSRLVGYAAAAAAMVAAAYVGWLLQTARRPAANDASTSSLADTPVTLESDSVFERRLAELPSLRYARFDMWAWFPYTASAKTNEEVPPPVRRPELCWRLTEGVAND